MSWCTVESDPGVFTELISSIGVADVQVEELYDLDLTSMLNLVPVYGLIFLFKWENDDVVDLNEGRQLLESSDEAHSIFFARQMITNACATQAIISVLMNSPSIELGSELSAFKSFTLDLPPDLRGEAIGSSELIRNAHNAFARPEPFIFEEKKDEKGEAEDAFHFIGYVPIQGQLYELDGLKPAPITLGQLTSEEPAEWLEKARASIQKRVEKYQEKEIRFNLLAIVKNRKQVYTEKIQQFQTRRQQMQQQLEEALANERQITTSDTSMDTSTTETSSSHSSLSSSSASAALLSDISSIDQELTDLSASLKEEDLKLEKWRIENIRRKHNYVPFIFNLLKLLAEKGKLSEVVEQAAKITAERNARQQLQNKKNKNNLKVATDKNQNTNNSTSQSQTESAAKSK